MSKYSCSKCGFTSLTKGTTKTHCTNKCKGSRLIENIVLVKCEICGKECETEKLMMLHKNNCVKKRVEIINEDTNGDLKKQNTEIMNMILSIRNELEKIREENKELKQRIEKIEGAKKVADDNRKKGYEEIEDTIIEDGEEVENYTGCFYQKDITFTPKNYEEILKEFDTENYKKNERKLKINVNLFIKNNTIGATAYPSEIVDNDGKKYKYGNTELYIKNVDCTRRAKYRVIKNGECYCMKHFNPETGSTVD